MAWIILMVIDGNHGARHVEIFHEHAFLLEVGDAHRTLYVLHTTRLAPFRHGIEQSGGDVDVVNKLYKTESNIASIPFLVCTAIDNACDSSHALAVGIIGNEGLHFGILESGILLRVECLKDIHV